MTTTFFGRLTAVLVLCFFMACAPQPEEPTYVPVRLPAQEKPKGDGYYCPMKCEGNKLYKSNRYPCPVCKMKLVHT